MQPLCHLYDLSQKVGGRYGCVGTLSWSTTNTLWSQQLIPFPVFIKMTSFFQLFAELDIRALCCGSEITGYDIQTKLTEVLLLIEYVD